MSVCVKSLASMRIRKLVLYKRLKDDLQTSFLYGFLQALHAGVFQRDPQTLKESARTFAPEFFLELNDDEKQEIKNALLLGMYEATLLVSKARPEQQKSLTDDLTRQMFQLTPEIEKWVVHGKSVISHVSG